MIKSKTLTILLFLIMFTAVVGVSGCFDSDENNATSPVNNSTPPSNNTTSSTPSPSGSIDSQLVGKWEYMNNYYYFFNDGRFQYVTSYPVSVYTGKYTTSKNRIYLTDIVYGAGSDTTYIDQNLAYSFGADKQGEYLVIPQYEPLRDGYGGNESSWAPKEFRKNTSFVP